MNSLSSKDEYLLNKIIENCDSIESRISKYAIDESVFSSDSDLREMVLFPLVQIGELANHLSDDFIESHSAIPWKDVIGMRHMVVHGYGILDYNWTWKTISEDIDPLKEHCVQVISNA